MTPLSDFSLNLSTHFRTAHATRHPTARRSGRPGARARASSITCKRSQDTHTHTPGVPRVQTKQGSRCSVKLFVRDLWHDIVAVPGLCVLSSCFGRVSFLKREITDCPSDSPDQDTGGTSSCPRPPFPSLSFLLSLSLACPLSRRSLRSLVLELPLTEL